MKDASRTSSTLGFNKGCLIHIFCLQVKWSGVRTQHSTTPFIDDMYDRLRETLNDYEVIICRWPEYVFVLEEVCFKM